MQNTIHYRSAMEQFKYNTTLINIVYTNDMEYRSVLRTLFGMSASIKTDILIDLDEVTADELDFDEAAVNRSLDYIYEKTRNHPFFQELYDLAAALMFSTDRSIGLSVLFSYDYMVLFHPCVCCLLEHPDAFCKEYEPFVKLHLKLTR